MCSCCVCFLFGFIYACGYTCKSFFTCLVSPIPSTSDEDDIFDIIQELEPLKFRWRSIGLGLRLKSSQLSAIEASHKHDMPGCVEEMVNCWLRKEFDTNKYGPPNWSQLVFAVGVPAGGSNPGVAQKLARKHSK